MKYFFILFFFFSITSFSQKKPFKRIDSTNYYIELVKFNKKTNNYKNCLQYSQKAIDYAIKTNNQKAIADSYSNLGTI